jgi:hypothetical protein
MTGFPHEYALYGLTLRSSRPLAGMAPPRGSDDVVLVDFAGALEDDVAAAPFWKNGFETLWHLDDRTWLLRYEQPGMESYRWTLRYDGGQRVTVRWDAEALMHDIPAVLQGPGIAAALHLRDVPLLHAGVIAVDGGAILLLGAPGAGKSTTAAALVRAGFPLVSDDLAAMSLADGRVLVHAGFPRLRLFTDSARAAGWNPDQLARAFVTPFLGDKRYVDVANGAFSAEPLPVRAIYLLAPRRKGGGEPLIAAMDRERVWPLLAENVYSLRFLDRARRARAMRDCATIAARVPVRGVEAGDDLAALPRLVEAIAADARAVRW